MELPFFDDTKRKFLALYDVTKFKRDINLFFTFETYRSVLSRPFADYHGVVYHPTASHIVSKLSSLYNDHAYGLHTSDQQPLTLQICQRFQDFTCLTEFSLLDISIHPNNLQTLLHGCIHALESLTLKPNFVFMTEERENEKRDSTLHILELIDLKSDNLTRLSLKLSPYWPADLGANLLIVQKNLELFHLEDVNVNLCSLLAILEPSVLKFVSLSKCSWPSSDNLIATLQPALLTRLTLVDCTIGNTKGVNMVLYQQIMDTFPKLAHLEVSLNSEVTFLEVISLIPSKVPSLCHFRLHSENDDFFVGVIEAAENIPISFVKSLLLGCPLSVPVLERLASIFTGLTRLYLDLAIFQVGSEQLGLPSFVNMLWSEGNETLRDAFFGALKNYKHLPTNGSYA